MDTVSPGNAAVHRIFAYPSGYRGAQSSTYIEGAAVTLEDGDLPVFVSSSTTPGGWVRSASITTSVNTRDPGLGMYAHALYVPTENAAPVDGVPAGTTQMAKFIDLNADCQGRVTRCPDSMPRTFTYTTDQDLDPGATGLQRVKEGSHTLQAKAFDLFWKTRDYQAGTLKVDRTRPDGTISGIGEAELARDRDYTIAATSTDPLSGSRSVQITLDGFEKARRDDCPANNNPCPLNWTLDGGDPALTEGTHTLRVITTDQVGNTATAATRTFKVERTKPTFEVDGSLLPTDTGWVAKGDQDLVIDAYDDPSSLPATGATYIEARIDGNQVEQPAEQACAAGGCEFGAEFVANTDGFAEGPHTLEVIVRDGAGNTADSDPIPFKLERTAPSLMLSGTLKAAEGQTLAEQTTYVLSATAMDTSGPTMRSGMGRIEVTLDDEAPDVFEQPCPFGACSMTSTYSFEAGEQEPGPRTFTVTATDHAGNQATEQFTVNNPEPPEPQCSPAPAQTASPVVPPIDPEVALQTFQLGLPEAFERWSLKDFDGFVIKPELEDRGDSYGASGSIAPMRIEKDPSDGATTTVETDDVPICVTPTLVDPNAADPEGIINDTAVLFADSAPGIDTLVRPTAVGSASILQLRDPQAPKSFSWEVDLQPGQQLKELPGGAVAVVEPVPEGSEIVTAGPAAPAVPTAAERIDALDDSQLHFDQSTGALLRALEEIPDEIAAVFPNTWAVDALDRPVATSLRATGSTITMTFTSELLPSAYPVVAGEEIVVADSLDEWEVLASEANTVDYSEEQLEEPQEPDPAPPEAPVDDIPDEEGELGGEVVDNPSVFLDSESEGNEEEESVDIAEANAAGKRVPPLRSRIALTETHPAVLYSSRREGLGAIRVRPVVPWRVIQMLEDPRPGTKGRREENRALLWESKTEGGAPKGYFNVATNPGAGQKSPGEATDIAIQFTQVKLPDKPEPQNTDVRAPRLATYKHYVGRLVRRYRSVMRSDNQRVGTLTAWNEPQLKDNFTYRKPVRAARYLQAAREACHPKKGDLAGKKLCNFVVAGEYAGEGKDDMIRYKGAKRSWQRIYERYLLNRRTKPRVWGFHNYGDPNSYQRKLGDGRSRWPITSRYYRRFRSDRFKLADGTIPKTWLTATGVYYHRNCGKGPGSPGGAGKLYRDYCAVPNGDPKTTVLFGMRSQSNTLVAMLRKIARDLPSMGRIYYYPLHDVKDASTHGGPAQVPGRIPKDTGRRAYDSGLVGSDDDAGYENRASVAVYRDPRRRDKKARGFSDPNEPRLAFCALREKVTTKNRPMRCPTGAGP